MAGHRAALAGRLAAARPRAVTRIGRIRLCRLVSRRAWTRCPPSSTGTRSAARPPWLAVPDRLLRLPDGVPVAPRNGGDGPRSARRRVRSDGLAGEASRRAWLRLYRAERPRRRADRGRRRRGGFAARGRCRRGPRSGHNGAPTAPAGRDCRPYGWPTRSGAAGTPGTVFGTAGLGRRTRCDAARYVQVLADNAARDRAVRVSWVSRFSTAPGMSTPVACRHAAGHLERELDPRPRRPRHRLAGTRRRRRAGHAGDQVRRRPVPDHAVRRLGYEVVHCGFNQWNGVAIASRVGIDDVQVGFDGQPTWSGKPDVEAAAEARALGATCDGVRVWSLYVPNGRTVDSPHYGYKLEWLAALKDTAHAGWPKTRGRRSRSSGDWNIAPTDEDVWSVEFYRGSTHVTEPERAAFNAIVDAQFTDVVRPFTPGPGRLHLLGLHPAAVPEEPGHAHRLHPRLTRAGAAGDPRRDRPRGTKRQGPQRPRARARRAGA